MRLLYTLAWWLALPLVLARLWLRGRQEPGYRQHWGERLGFYPRQLAPAPATLWLHAVSVGETRAAEPLIDALLAAWPDSRIVLTHMTPTGRATGKTLFAKHGARLVQSYLPYDTGAMPARFIRHFAPRICILMETEVWPNLIHQCNRYKVPVVLANARLSQRSLGKAQRLGKLITDAARGITLVAAQTQDDAERVRVLGVQNVVVTGSIKFDVVVPAAALATGAALRAAIGARPVLLCASTREGEEQLLLEALARASLPPDVQLLVHELTRRVAADAQLLVGHRYVDRLLASGVVGVCEIVRCLGSGYVEGWRIDRHLASGVVQGWKIVRILGSGTVGVRFLWRGLASGVVGAEQLSRLVGSGVVFGVRRDNVLEVHVQDESTYAALTAAGVTWS